VTAAIHRGRRRLDCGGGSPRSLLRRCTVSTSGAAGRPQRAAAPPPWRGGRALQVEKDLDPLAPRTDRHDARPVPAVISQPHLDGAHVGVTSPPPGKRSPGRASSATAIGAGWVKESSSWLATRTRRCPASTARSRWRGFSGCEPDPLPCGALNPRLGHFLLSSLTMRGHADGSWNIAAPHAHRCGTGETVRCASRRSAPRPFR